MRWRNLLVGLLVAGACFIPLSSHAAVKSYKELTAADNIRLEESERRLIIYDRALETLESAHAERKISRSDYEWQRRDLISYIGEEANLQNDILTKSSHFADDLREAMENVAKYTVMAGEVVLYVALRIAPGFSGASFRP